MVDKPLGAGLKLFIVNISLENVLHTCHYKENKNLQTYIHIRSLIKEEKLVMLSSRIYLNESYVVHQMSLSIISTLIHVYRLNMQQINEPFNEIK